MEAKVNLYTKCQLPRLDRTVTEIFFVERMISDETSLLLLEIKGHLRLMQTIIAIFTCSQKFTFDPIAFEIFLWETKKYLPPDQGLLIQPRKARSTCQHNFTSIKTAAIYLPADLKHRPPFELKIPCGTSSWKQTVASSELRNIHIFCNLKLWFSVLKMPKQITLFWPF